MTAISLRVCTSTRTRPDPGSYWTLPASPPSAIVATRWPRGLSTVSTPPVSSETNARRSTGGRFAASEGDCTRDLRKPERMNRCSCYAPAVSHGVQGRTHVGTLDAVTANHVAETMQALATPSRVRILGRLRESACSVGEL